MLDWAWVITGVFLFIVLLWRSRQRTRGWWFWVALVLFNVVIGFFGVKFDLQPFLDGAELSGYVLVTIVVINYVLLERLRL